MRGLARAASARGRMELMHTWNRTSHRWLGVAGGIWIGATAVASIGIRVTAAPPAPTFTRRVLAPSLPEAPFDLRYFSGPVKTNSRGEIITGRDDDPVKKIVGAEAAGPRAGLDRFTKILFGVGYFDGRPDPGTRIDPNDPQV